MVIIFVGVPGSGKSTIAKILVEKLEERGSQLFPIRTSKNRQSGGFLVE